MGSREGDTVKGNTDWEEAVRRALKKKRPKKGWPKPKKTARKPR